MFKNYLKVVLRNILRHKGYSLINIVGLAVGIACCILILLWVQDELSFDRFHKNGDDICRVLQDIHLDRDVTWAINQGPLGPALKADIPEIVNYTRSTARRFRIKYNDKRFDERVEFADPSFFEMFDFPLVKGDPKRALIDPHSIVISEEMAVKYFGSEEPLGKVLNADDQYDFVVSGVLAKVPRNSHLRPQFIIPFVFGRELEYTVDNWGNSQFTTYVMLKKGVSRAAVEKKIARFLDDKPTLEEGTILRLQPLTRIHLYSNFEFDRFGRGDIKYIHIFSITAFFVLLIACINFMNLATARSATRAREVGMRKVVGAKRSGLIRQFFAESIFFALVALILAILLVELLLPVFNNLAGKEMTLKFLSNPLLLAGILGITLFTGLISGSYPALLLSSFRPIHVLKGKFETGHSKSLSRKILVVTQFSLSLIMIIGTFIVYKQLDYMRNKKLGYNKENLVYIVMRGDFFKKYDAIKNDLLQHPGILGVTRSTAIPSYGNVFSNSKWRWKGQNPKEEVLMHGNFVGYDYFKTFGMKIKEGRSFSKEFSTDQSAVVLNEEAVKRMEVTSPIGMELVNGDNKYTIVGIVKNYHFRSLHKKIEPLVLIFAPGFCRGLIARIKSGDIPSSIGFLEKKWKQFASDYPFNYGFLDKRLDRLYRAEQQVGTLFKYFTVLTIFISCLGLFGLASFMAERRTKEIGIRKTLGASVTGITLMLSKEFSRLVLFANIIGWPIAYFAMNKWLQNFAYRTAVSLEIFIFGGILALMIAWLTISYQSIKAALINPVEALRYE
ncbi:MAG: ABC transporter permease [Candidatus Aminicenantes bacterium]|nr:MAG: ABC transporter permease [Candidatus Aminicenantes bacterium]